MEREKRDVGLTWKKKCSRKPCIYSAKFSSDASCHHCHFGQHSFLSDFHFPLVPLAHYLAVLSRCCVHNEFSFEATLEEHWAVTLYFKLLRSKVDVSSYFLLKEICNCIPFQDEKMKLLRKRVEFFYSYYISYLQQAFHNVCLHRLCGKTSGWDTSSPVLELVLFLRCFMLISFWEQSKKNQLPEYTRSHHSSSSWGNFECWGVLVAGCHQLSWEGLNVASKSL